MKKIPFALSILAIAVSSAAATTVPDAGTTLQQINPGITTPVEQSPRTVNETAAAATMPSGGPTFRMEHLEVLGNSLLSDEEISELVKPFVGKELDMTGLQSLADKITAHYKFKGYVYAFAFLPAQEITAHTVLLQVVEGRYGTVKTVASDGINSSDSDVYLAGLKPGAMIESSSLERAIALLHELPGITVAPVLKPGINSGEADLEVTVGRPNLISGSVGIDTWGNRYTGENRIRGEFNVNSGLTFGDQFKVGLLGSDQNLSLGSVEYSAPIGRQGLRGNISHAQTSYQLGSDFKSLDAHGTAQVDTLGVSFPLVRAPSTNVTLTGSYQRKNLVDDKSSVGSHESKSSEGATAGASFDHRDEVLGGGVTFGAASFTAGSLSLDAGLSAADTASTAGTFGKVNIELARIQSVSKSISLFGRVTGQMADKNLDSSESFSLGGPTAVRAFPLGESSGDSGYVAQVEARYKTGDFTPFVFFDAGVIKTRANPLAGGKNDREISGAGFGVRYQSGSLSAEVTAAWRTTGGAPTADSADGQPKVWFSLSYRF